MDSYRNGDIDNRDGVCAMIFFVAIMLALFAGILAVILLDKRFARWAAALFASVALAIIIIMFFYYLTGRMVGYSESIPYISTFGISLQFYANEFSVPLSLLAGIVGLAAIIGGNPLQERAKASNSLILLFELAAIGLFASGNLFLFFIFWDVGIIAVFFMISCLGEGNNLNSAKVYLFYSLLASALLLFGILMIYFYTPIRSFNISTIEAGAQTIPLGVQEVIFVSLLIAFMIKMPVFPFHSWMQGAYSDASTQGSMLIGGVLSKFGAYGILLIFLMLPIARTYAPYILIIAIVSAFYAAFNGIRKDDLKRMAAFTSMAESAIILTGVTALGAFGLDGAVYGMVAFGLGISLMFLSIGSVEFMYGSKHLSTLRGIVKGAASTAYSFLFGVFAATGVPITAAFIADLLIFIGADKSFGVLGVVPLFSIIIVGAYLYYAINKSFFDTENSIEIVRYETGHWNPSYALLIFSILALGIVPALILGFR